MRWLVALVLVAPVGAEPPDLDEVVCTWCHFDEGDDFAASVHYHEGHILCNDCHGGLPFEEDPDLAKAEGTGFIGKPGRDRVAQVCAQCHSGPAGFFAQGPHHDWANEANPTCVTCHGNHGVLAADLSLIDATCGECHDEWSAALDRGRKIKIELAVAAEHLARVGRVVDSLGVEVRAVRQAEVFIEEAGGVLRRAGAATHAMDLTVIGEMVGEMRGDGGIGGAERVVAEYYEDLHGRPWVVAGVWVFVGVNIFVLWWKRRELAREEE